MCKRLRHDTTFFTSCFHLPPYMFSFTRALQLISGHGCEAYTVNDIRTFVCILRTLSEISYTFQFFLHIHYQPLYV